MTDTEIAVTTGERSGGGRPSEDRIFRAPGAVIVLDGVSTVSDEQPRGGWYAQVLGERLVSLLGTAPPLTDLREVLGQAIGAVASDHRLVPGASPAATVSIVRHRAGRVDALVLADSPVVALMADGSVEEVRDDRLARLVAGCPESKEYRARLRSGLGFGAPEHRGLLKKLRDHQMLHINREVDGGYWVAEAVAEAADHAVVRSWPAAGLAEILAMTDGVSCGVEEYDLYPTWTDLAHACRADGPDRVVDTVHEAEAQDPDGSRWPRYKVHDDKALAFLTFTAPAPAA